MNTDNLKLLAIFDDEIELLSSKYEIEEITDCNSTFMSGGGGGGGGGR